MATTYNLENFLLKPNRKFDRWTLSSKLGSGGNGEVWKCRDDEKKEYAIKFLKWGKGLAYNRFLDEVAFMEQYKDLSGILPVEGKNLPSNKPNTYNKSLPFFYVMPLAKPAEHLIAQMSMDDKIKVVIELLEMLTSLHSKGVAHRDIKPANILYHNGNFVLSDFGLVFFSKKMAKTPKGTKIGAKWTISPQMERDAQSADKFKADVYSMAKTIWIILTGENLGFEGQYSPNSIMRLQNFIKTNRYLYPLEKLLMQCTDHDEDMRPTAAEMESRFKDWVQLNDNWNRENLLQWAEVQEQLFPSIVPTQAIWTNRDDIIGVLRLLAKYNSLNHMFFPDMGGLDLTDSALSYEEGCIELRCDGLIYIVKPKRLMFEYINDETEWNYFRLEAEQRSPISDEVMYDGYSEELCEIAPLKYESLHVLDEMTSEEYKRICPRHIIRYLKGSFIFFHKDSIFNHYISKYKGEHDKISADQFRSIIERLAEKFKGQNMETIRSRYNTDHK